ncbi:hypothetical protein DM01DRAFT_327242 [Hesseltinella vesiculosa]|uniref:Uncharacterized protein n=1 Tax=Hesseltinella vesiculosa TaxID=101127 RepID=A0A1X2GTD8_9FUNG|nr:hypothetical protein DM01DRAFT_327242 [Hesseltinella vesiculosa]
MLTVVIMGEKPCHHHPGGITIYNGYVCNSGEEEEGGDGPPPGGPPPGGGPPKPPLVQSAPTMANPRTLADKGQPIENNRCFIM